MYVWNETILFVIDRKLNEGLFKSIFWISLFSHVNSVPERGSWETIAITLHFSVRFYFFVFFFFFFFLITQQHILYIFELKEQLLKYKRYILNK